MLEFAFRCNHNGKANGNHVFGYFLKWLGRKHFIQTF